MFRKRRPEQTRTASPDLEHTENSEKGTDLNGPGSEADARKTVHYSAFISYRHLPLDQFAAMQVHRMLEHYILPKEHRKNPQHKHIDHIFRDQDELPLSGDLSASILEALYHSDRLIVICTPETQKSKWVCREIETFLSFHPREDVTAVLVDGEPSEAFPPQLLSAPDPEHPGQMIAVEPLAADIRAADNAGRKKRLQAQKLRMMAQILDVPYDSLVQRDRTFRMKRTMAYGSVILAAVSGFALYAALQNMRISHLYDQTTRDLAGQVVQSAGSLIDQGYPAQALDALVSLEESHPGLETAGQYESLVRLLQPYPSLGSDDFTPLFSLEAHWYTNQNPVFSPSLAYGAYIENGYPCTFVNMETGQKEWLLTMNDLDERFPENQVICGVQFLDDRTAILLSEGAVYKVDVKNHSILASSMYAPRSENLNNEEVFLKDEICWILSAHKVFCFDLQAMELLSSQAFEYDPLHMEILGYAVDPKSHALAVSFSPESETENPAADKGQILLFDPEGSSPCAIRQRGGFGLVWLKDGSLFWIEKEAGGMQGQNYHGTLRTYAHDQLSEPWGDFYGSGWLNDQPVVLMEFEDGRTLPVIYHQNEVMAADPESQTIVWCRTYPFSIKSLASVSSRGFLHASQHEIGLTLWSDQTGSSSPLLWTHTAQSSRSLESLWYAFDEKTGTRRIAAQCEDGLQVWQRQEDDARILSLGRVLQARAARLADGTRAVQAVSCMEETSPEGTETVRYLWTCLDLKGNLLYQQEVNVSLSSEEFTGWPGFALGLDGQKNALYYTEDITVCCLDLNTNKTNTVYESGSDSPLYLCASQDARRLLISEDTGTILLDPQSRRGLSLFEEPADFAQWSMDGRYVILSLEDGFCVWDTQQSEFVLLPDGSRQMKGSPLFSPGQLTRQGMFHTTDTGVKLAKSHNWILFENTEDGNEGTDSSMSLMIYDLDSRSAIRTIELEKAYASQRLNLDSLDLSEDDQTLFLLTDRLGAEGRNEPRQAVLRRYAVETGALQAETDISLDEDWAMWRNSLFAGPEDQILIHGSRSYEIAPQTGYVKAAAGLFEASQNGFEPKITWLEDQIFWIGEYGCILQNSASGEAVLRPLMNTEELSRLAREKRDLYQAQEEEAKTAQEKMNLAAGESRTEPSLED